MCVFTPNRLFAAALTFAVANVANAGDFSQIEALANSQVVNKNGSDQSMQESTTNAMTALMKLAKADRTGAITKGYEAFGEYRNSGDLDGMRLKNSINALKMDSMGSYIASSGLSSVFMAPISDYNTSYARLDPSFLHKGAAGKVAEEFEKQTGMKRETFLKKLATASESSISSSDPKMVDKVLSRFESFVSEIPNQDFRDKVQKQVDSVPQTVRTGLISQALQKASQYFAGSHSPAKSDVALNTKDSAKTASVPEPGQATSANAKTGSSSAYGAVTGVKNADERNPASMTTMLAERTEFRNITNDKFGSDAVGGALQTALDEQGGDDTIFKQISRKYRSLSPSMLQKEQKAI